ncbi:MAG TPA: bifunctional serine/threonine-protein kinase/formylglycine-generating enzyme family protein [Bryobacteraceae bacterium]|nr:bifunctional serine/threonine-protein kinase/formylglycine-generating enzyme family protein [Bryobacteraceae bacterium]
MSVESIGPYQLLEELGRGAMGVVFRGFDPAIGRSVAIKIIQAGQFASPEEKSDLRVRFAREAAAAGRLSHPNIVTVYQLGQDGDTQYLVLELVDGCSLEKTLAGGQPQDPKTAVSIVTQVADALDYAHSEGIVHRDVKPANILVRPDGKAKITDFGIAHIASQTVTRSGFTFGTPAYISPEQIETSQVSGRADQYSLGVIAYQMLSGKRPFAADTGPSLMFKIMEAKAPTLHSLNPAISPDTSAAIAKAMARKPEDRYASCKEFAEQLSESLSAATADTQNPRPEAVAATPAPNGEVPTRERESGERLIAAAGTRTSTGTSRLGLWIAGGVAVAVLAAVAWVWWHGAARPTSLPVLPAGTTKVNAKDGLTYVWVPPGSFEMGCSPADGECAEDEKPVHQVTISRGFRMGQTEVTQEAWQRVMGTDPSHFKGPKLPVESVSWDEARSYCRAVGMRLPTEAEWEYGARAGSSRNSYGDLEQVAWYARNSGGMTHEVGGKQANPWGLQDMLGNVWEWVDDWFASPYPAGNATDPKGPASGKARTIRGGAWGLLRKNAHLSLRGAPGPMIPGSHIGVRCAGNSLP